MTSNFVVVVSVLLPICCHIGCGMPYLCFFVEQVVTLLGAITDNVSVVVISSLPGKGATKIYTLIFLLVNFG